MSMMILKMMILMNKDDDGNEDGDIGNEKIMLTIRWRW
jgi:hypothetical protein